ncbi:SDR family oxidoreductase [Nonomuraea sp. NPDC050691]|uniref:SDR family NAD(P)-dependent oxidoreductase n=1 Tax=Nonomuraea sp. NPDC050691 TaxID=3155661 RepID=UPI0033C1BF85
MTSTASEKRVAVITGAASGIGRALAVAYASHGVRTVSGTYPGDPHDPAETLRQVERGGGSGVVHEVDVRDYAAAKAGVIGLTKSLALEVAEHNVLVNAIAPGPVETPMVAGITDAWKSAKRAELPLGRFGRPEEVAPTAVLLATDPGGNLYVGQTLGPNSGDVMP